MPKHCCRSSTVHGNSVLQHMWCLPLSHLPQYLQVGILVGFAADLDRGQSTECKVPSSWNHDRLLLFTRFKVRAGRIVNMRAAVLFIFMCMQSGTQSGGANQILPPPLFRIFPTPPRSSDYIESGSLLSTLMRCGSPCTPLFATTTMLSVDI